MTFAPVSTMAGLVAPVAVSPLKPGSVSKVCSALKELLGTGYEIVFREVTKNNGVRLHGVIITGKGSNVSPTIYI